MADNACGADDEQEPDRGGIIDGLAGAGNPTPAEAKAGLAQAAEILLKDANEGEWLQDRVR